MKQKYFSLFYFAISIVFIILSLQIKAQDCEIGAIQVEVLPCNESGFFRVVINFDYANVGNEGFRIQGNGHNYGNFEYSALPVTLYELNGDGETVYEFVVLDNQFEGCSNSTWIEPVNCGGNEDCFIGELTVEHSPCESGLFNIYLDFEYDNVSDEGFKLFVNSDLFGEYSYAELPLNIGSFEGDGETVYHFLVTDMIYDGCASDKNLGPVDCNGEGCHIWELVLDQQSCEEGMFNVLVNFNYSNVSDEGFKVMVNEELMGEYAYNELPVSVGPFAGDGETIYHFLIKDLGFEGCAEDGNLGPVNCDGDCHIWEVGADVLECNEEGMFNVRLNFNHTNTGNEGFRVQGNGHNYGNFGYGDLPVIVGPLAGDGITEYEFVVIDNQFDGCSNWTAIEPVDCEGNGECFIGELIIDDHPCENGQYSVYLNFEYDNVSSEGFKLFINWELYESYSYEDLPLNIGPFEGDGETQYHFLVRDKQFEACASDRLFGPVECESSGECEIWDMTATALPCNEEDQFNVLINFLYDNVGDDGFTIRGNGNNYGSFSYEDLPVELGPFEADGETTLEFIARDNHFESCFKATGLPPFLCDTTFRMMNTSLEIVDCQNEIYYLNINFDYINAHSASFVLSGNEAEPRFYNFADLPVKAGPFANDEITSYYFIIKDAEQLSHGDWKRFYPFNCENLGISDNDLNHLFNVYPNPSVSEIFFENHSTTIAILEVYDFSGKQIKQLPLETNSKNAILLDISGLYFYRIMSEEGIVSGKLVVK